MLSSYTKPNHNVIFQGTIKSGTITYMLAMITFAASTCQQSHTPIRPRTHTTQSSHTPIASTSHTPLSNTHSTLPHTLNSPTHMHTHRQPFELLTSLVIDEKWLFSGMFSIISVKQSLLGMLGSRSKQIC